MVGTFGLARALPVLLDGLVVADRGGQNDAMWYLQHSRLLHRLNGLALAFFAGYLIVG
jgi:hypothetical protein